MSGPRENGCGVVAFDNTGTLSRSVVEVVAVREDADFDAPVPEISPSRPAALVSVALDDDGAFERADRSVLVSDGGDPDADLTRLADTVVRGIEDVPDLL